MFASLLIKLNLIFNFLKMNFLPHLNDKNNWQLFNIIEEKEILLKKVDCDFKEAFIGGILIEKNNLKLMVYDKEFILENFEGKKLKFISNRRLKKFLYDEYNNYLTEVTVFT